MRDIERQLMIEALKTCEAPSIIEAKAMIQTLTDGLTQAHMQVDRLDDVLPGRALEFSAWGFAGDDLPERLQDRSFYIVVRMHEANGRTVSFCQITDVNTQPGMLDKTEAAWLHTLAPWVSRAAALHEEGRPETPTHTATTTRFYDLSSGTMVQSISMLKVSHKIELTVLRSAER